jgi:hypothetical protein
MSCLVHSEVSHTIRSAATTPFLGRRRELIAQPRIIAASSESHDRGLAYDALVPNTLEMLDGDLVRILWVFTLLGFAFAQTNTSTCCDVDPSTVGSNVRLSWCRAQQNTCPELCANGQTSTNICDPVRAVYIYSATNRLIDGY